MNDEKIVQAIAEKHGTFISSLCGLGDAGPNQRRALVVAQIASAIREAISLSREQKWIPCSERLPEVSPFCGPKKYFMVCDAKDRMSIAYRYSDHPQAWTMAKPIGIVTHWMVLPEPPSAPLTDVSTDEVEDRKEE